MLNQNPRHADFVLGSCPHCDKVVRIPVTALTSQSSSQVRCPICDLAFEIGEVLEDMIPLAEVVEDAPEVKKPETDPPPKSPKSPDRINAIDTPDLFHVSKDDYEPITEKRNGRFVVPELLSKGIKKKRKRTRRKKTRSSDDPEVAQRLEQLKKNSSRTSLPVGGDASDPEQDSEKRRSSRRRSSSSTSSRSSRSSSRGKTSKSKRAKRSFSQLLGLEKPASKVEYIMVGLGVVMAVPILHLLMWWFVGIDPLGLAKPTSYVLPAIVPNELKMDASELDIEVPAMPQQEER